MRDSAVRPCRRQANRRGERTCCVWGLRTVELQCSQVVNNLGTFDGLVNNAGVAKLAPFLDVPLADFDHIMNINVKAVLVVSQVT